MQTEELTQADRVELVNLYHLAPTALADLDHVPTPYERMCWAAKQFASEHAETGMTEAEAMKQQVRGGARAYRALCSALGR
jgi:hypothetical protein